MTTPISIVSRFEGDAAADYQRRLQEVKRVALRYLTEVPPRQEFDVRELFRVLCLIDSQERHVLLNRVMHNSDGPKTLEGMEALCSFVGNYMCDDGECLVVPEPHDPENDAYFSATLDRLRHQEGNEGLSEDELHAKAMEEYLDRERPLVVVPKMTDEGRPARAGEVLAAILHNRAMEERRREELVEIFGEDDEFIGAPLPKF